MGQKVNPRGFRLGVVEHASSAWYADRANYVEFLHRDYAARLCIEKEKEFSQAGVSSIVIKRPARNAIFDVSVARSGILMSKKDYIAEVRAKLTAIMGVPVHLTISEVKKPDLSAKLVADNIAQQLEKRVMFRRLMKRAVTTAMRAGALGVKVRISGRIGGAEIARSEWYREGRVPLHTLRANIDYHLSEAHTTYGVLGVKVWIFKGEVIGEPAVSQQDETAAAPAA